jgi:hypothetical protein
MSDDKLEVQIREATNGWILDLSKSGQTVEYIFVRPGPALTLVKRVMTGQENVFHGISDD